MGRKSRLKRDRAKPDPVTEDAESGLPEADQDRAVRDRAMLAHERATKPMGARVARVAVDDETWAAFRKLCGTTPASIRLGQLVTAEVQRARDLGRESDPVAAVNAIRGHVDELDALLRGGPR